VRHNQDWRKAYPLHEDIVTAIRKRRPEAARRAARQLLADTSKVLAQHWRKTDRPKRSA
jgi:DNA-binding FadR family transcriptional regulator